MKSNVGKEFKRELEAFDRIKKAEEVLSSKIVEDLTTTEKYVIKLNGKLEELDRMERVRLRCVSRLISEEGLGLG